MCVSECVFRADKQALTLEYESVIHYLRRGAIRAPPNQMGLIGSDTFDQNELKQK